MIKLKYKISNEFLINSITEIINLETLKADFYILNKSGLVKSLQLLDKSKNLICNYKVHKLSIYPYIDVSDSHSNNLGKIVRKGICLCKASFNLNYKNYSYDGNLFTQNYVILDENKKEVGKVYVDDTKWTNYFYLEVNRDNQLDVMNVVIMLEYLKIVN